jgi:ABC-type glycerol-3-phosphate transport system substrate-binding protein
VSRRPRRCGARRVVVRSPLLSLALLATVGAAACSGGDAAAGAGAGDPAPTATAMGATGADPTGGTDDDVQAEEEQEQHDVAVAFDGSSCSHDAPTEVGAGSLLRLEAVNAADDVIEVVIAQLLDDATFEDFVEYHQPEPKVTGPPDYVVGSGSVGAQPGTTETSSFRLQGGEYALVCLQFTGQAEPAVWVAQPGGITVTG